MASNELIFRYALKRFPSDFRVSEVLLPAVVEPSTDSFHYLRLTKSGYTTFEAIDLVASHLGLASSQVGYAGLKDEDAVTDQYLSIAGFVAQREIDRFNHLYLAGGYQSEAPFMQLQHHCHSDRGLEAGELDGNSFRIVVRDLHEDRANRLADVKSRYNFFFINYYDTQRFGVPHGPKQTHLIGQAISVKDYATAFRLLKSSCSPEAAKCAEFTGTPEDFFGHLDQRRVAFYLSASSSATWNEQVRQGLRDTSTGGLVELSRDGIPYSFPRSTEAVLGFLAHGSAFEYHTYRSREGRVFSYPSRRPVVTQTQMRVSNVRPDDSAPGQWRCDMQFFLSSGCYATMAVAQFLHQIETEQ